MIDKKSKLTIKQTPLPVYEHGKLPPQALDLEEAVLGALMLEKDTLTVVLDQIRPINFYKEANQVIYQAIVNLAERSEPSDYLMVINELKSTGELEFIGGPYYITQLTGKVGGTTNAEHHCRIIIQKFIQRELIRISSIMIEDAYEDTTDVFTLLDQAHSNLNDMTLNAIQHREKTTLELVAAFNNKLDKSIANRTKKEITGTSTGFKDLDRMIDGWQDSDLIIIAGRPSMGKTALATGFMRHVITVLNRPVAMFSLEMTDLQLIGRLVSQDTGISITKIRKGEISNDDMNLIQASNSKFFDKKQKGLLIIDDNAMITITELRARAKRIMSEHNPALFIVDYLQLMNGEGGRGESREQVISTISRQLKILAKELNVPVIALSQLNREVEGTRWKRPNLSHLRESGAIEQDADIVIFCYRAHYYFQQGEARFEDVEVHGEMRSSEGLGELIVAKHRQGATGIIPVRFENEIASYSDLYQKIETPVRSFIEKDDEPF